MSAFQKLLKVIQKTVNSNCVNGSCHIIPFVLAKNDSFCRYSHFRCSAKLNGDPFFYTLNRIIHLYLKTSVRLTIIYFPYWWGFLMIDRHTARNQIFVSTENRHFLIKSMHYVVLLASIIGDKANNSLCFVSNWMQILTWTSMCALSILWNEFGH